MAGLFYLNCYNFYEVIFHLIVFENVLKIAKVYVLQLIKLVPLKVSIGGIRSNLGTRFELRV